MKRVPKSVLVYTLLLLYTLGPLICVLISGGIASHFGCRLDESGTHPCIVGGVDIGGTLVTLFVMGWLMLLTIPTGAIALLAYTIVLIATRATNAQKG